MTQVTFADRLVRLGLNIVMAASVLIVGYLLVRFAILPLFRWLLRKYGVDEVFVNFAVILANILLLVVVGVMALDALGLDTGYIIALLAAVLIALVAAMQGWLQNVAGGLWMFLNSPFKLDDLVDIAGKRGRVEEIQLLTTKLRTRDNLTVILPNHTVVSNIITNFHARPIRRIELVITIQYEDDLQRAIEELRNAVQEDPRILADPKPIIAVADLTLNGVQIDVRPWVKKEDFTATQYALRERIKHTFDANSITFAYSQMQLHGLEKDS